MSRDSLTGEARVSFKCSEELSQMIDAVARYERRPLSAVCRIALNDYFANKGYYDAATVAGKKNTDAELPTDHD